MKKTLSLVATFALAAAMSAFAQQDTTPQSAPTANNPTTTSPSSDQSSTSQGSTTAPSSDQSSTSQSTTTSGSSSMSQDAQSGSTMSHDSAAAQSYTGTVVKGSDGKYVLKTDTGSYQIDDQDKAKQYEGKQVKVNGTLDSATSMLHVTDISPAS